MEELEKQNENDKSSDETKYCNVLESFKKNNKIKDFVVSVLTEKTENQRKVVAILKVMSEKYERTMSEKVNFLQLTIMMIIFMEMMMMTMRLC